MVGCSWATGWECPHSWLKLGGSYLAGYAPQGRSGADGTGMPGKAAGERIVGGETRCGQKLQGREAEPHPWEQSVGSAELGFRHGACLRHEPSDLGCHIPPEPSGLAWVRQHPPRVPVHWKLRM